MRNKLSARIIWIFIFAFLASWVSPVWGDVIAWEDFSSCEPGKIVGQGGAFNGWGGPWREAVDPAQFQGPQVIDASIEHPSVVSGGLALGDGGLHPIGGRCIRDLSGPAQSGVYWFSFVFKPPMLEGGGSNQYHIFDTTHVLEAPSPYGASVQNMIGGFRIHDISDSEDNFHHNEIQILDNSAPLVLNPPDETHENNWYSGEQYMEIATGHIFDRENPVVLEDAAEVPPDETWFFAMRVDTASRAIDYFAFSQTDVCGHPNAATWHRRLVSDPSRSVVADSVAPALWGSDDFPSLGGNLRLGETYADVAPLTGPLLHEGFGAYTAGEYIANGPAARGSGLLGWQGTQDTAGGVLEETLLYTGLFFHEGRLDAQMNGEAVWGAFDMSEFGPFVNYTRDDGKIGKTGTTLHMSFLMRLTVGLDVNEPTLISLGGGDPFEPDIAMGHAAGDGFFSAGGAEIAPLDNETHLFVLAIEFGDAGDTVQVYFDPVVGQPAPAPSATLSGLDLAFDKLRIRGGSNPAEIDEIRFAGSYENATPKYTEFTLTVEAENGGIQLDPFKEGFVYIKGTNVRFKAVPLQGYHFAGWGGDLSGADNPVYMKFDSDKHVVAYFEPVTIAEKMAAVTVDESITGQEILGFGANLTGDDPAVAAAYQDAAFRDYCANDLAAGLLHLELCPEVSPDPVAEAQNISFADFDLDAAGGKARVMLDFITAMRAENPDLKVVASPSSPPAWMKDNGSLTGTKLGTIDQDDRTWDDDNRLSDGKYGHMAAWLAEWAKLMESRGTPLHGIGPQIMPAVTRAANSCLYTPEEYASLVEHLGAGIAAAGLAFPPLIFGPEDSSIHISRSNTYQEAVMEGPAAGYLGAFASREYLDASLNSAAGFYWRFIESYGKPYWITGGPTGGHPWPEPLANLGCMTHNALAGNHAAGVCLGQLVLPQAGENGLLIVGGETKKAAVFRHFSNFIQPGAAQVDVDPGWRPVEASAYKNPGGGALVIIVINRQIEHQPLTIHFAQPPAFDYLKVYQTSWDDDVSELHPVAVADQQARLLLLAESIVTLVGDPAAPALPVRQLELASEGEGGSVFTYGGDSFIDGAQVDIHAAPVGECVRFSHWSGGASGGERVNPVTVLMDGGKSVTGHFEPLVAWEAAVDEPAADLAAFPWTWGGDSAYGDVYISADVNDETGTTNDYAYIQAIIPRFVRSSTFEAWAETELGIIRVDDLTKLRFKADVAASHPNKKANFVLTDAAGNTAAYSPKLVQTAFNTWEAPVSEFTLSGPFDPTLGPVKLRFEYDGGFKSWFKGQTYQLKFKNVRLEFPNWCALPEYQLTAGAGEGGTVSPESGFYKETTIAEVTAQPDPGYYFDNWSGDDVPAGAAEDNPISLTMDAGKTVTANFYRPDPVRVRVDGQDFTQGGTFGWTPYVAADAVAAAGMGPGYAIFTGDLTAAASNYICSLWTYISPPLTASLKDIVLSFEISGNVSGGQYMFYLSDSQGTTGFNRAIYRGVIAEAGVFESVSIPLHELESALGAFQPGVTPEPYKLWIAFMGGFETWSQTEMNEIHLKSWSLTSASETGTVYTVTADAGPGGRVLDFWPYYLSGTEAVLAAAADAGFIFGGWTGDVTGAGNPITFAVDGDKNLTANFRKAVMVNSDEFADKEEFDWTVLGGGETDEEFTFSSGLRDGYGYINMDSSGADTSSWFWGVMQRAAGPFHTSDLSQIVLTAEMAGTPAGQFKISLINSDGQDPRPALYYDGEFAWDGMFETFVLPFSAFESQNGADGSPFDPKADNILLQIEYAGGFDAWPKGAVNEIRARSVRIESGNDAGGVFSLAVTAGEGGAVTEAGGHYLEGAVAEIAAAADEGYAFAGWSGDASGTDNPLAVAMDGDKTIGALFAPAFTLTVTAGEGGSVSAVSGVYAAGAEAEITAVPEEGWFFAGWSGDAAGADNPLTVTMDAGKEITALFSWEDWVWREKFGYVYSGYEFEGWFYFKPLNWVYEHPEGWIWTRAHHWQYPAGDYTGAEGLYLYDLNLGWLSMPQDTGYLYYWTGRQWLLFDGSTAFPERVFHLLDGTAVNEDQLPAE